LNPQAVHGLPPRPKASDWVILDPVRNTCPNLLLQQTRCRGWRSTAGKRC